jgi:WXG100 family type VII secretion target
VADGPTTFEEFKVDLQQLHNAIGSVRREHTAIRDAMSAIGNEFGAVKEAWGTPSTATYDDVQAWFMKVSNDLEDLLNDMANRLQTAYNNYKHAEETNVKNATPHGGHHPGDNGADRHVVTHHGEQHPAATLREGRMATTPSDGHATATLREATRPTDPDMSAALLRRGVSIPPNSE